MLAHRNGPEGAGYPKFMDFRIFDQNFPSHFWPKKRGKIFWHLGGPPGPLRKEGVGWVGVPPPTFSTFATFPTHPARGAAPPLPRASPRETPRVPRGQGKNFCAPAKKPI